MSFHKIRPVVFNQLPLPFERGHLLPRPGKRVYSPNCFAFPVSDASLGGEAQISLPAQMLTFPLNSPPAHSGAAGDFAWQLSVGTPGAPGPMAAFEQFC